MSREAGKPPSFPPTRAGSDRLIALFLFGLVAFNPPLLRVFGVGETVFGMPLLYVYALGVWAAVIGLSAVFLERGGRS